MNKSADKKVDEKIVTIQLSQITRNLQIVDDFTEPEMSLATNLSPSDRQVATSVAQCETNHIKYCIHVENDEDDAGFISDSDRENFLEGFYWEKSGKDKINRQQKLQTSNRKTVRECNVIANSKRVTRQPSYFGFDDRTCHILESIPLKMGLLANVAGKGSNSLVIYTDLLPSNKIYFSDGCAVKVYKLGSDVKKNLAISKRAHREEENLRKIKFTLAVPYVLYRSRNIIVTNFIGFDQETAPSIDSISDIDYLVMYRSVVEEIVKWYNKAEVVHGNLSSKSLVYFYDRICYIGWSHSVRRKHPLALTKLMKDCHFVTKFFGREGVPVKPTEELFKEITGLDKISSKVLEVLSKKDLWQDLHPNNPNRISEDGTRPSRKGWFKK